LEVVSITVNDQSHLLNDFIHGEYHIIPDGSPTEMMILLWKKAASVSLFSKISKMDDKGSECRELITKFKNFFW